MCLHSNLLDATIRCLNFCCATFELLLRHQDTLNHNLPTARLRLQGRFAESFLLLLADANKAHTDTHASLAKSSLFKKLGTLLDLCVSSLRRGHANLLCIVPILSDDPRRESGKWCISYVHVVPAHATILTLQMPARQKPKHNLHLHKPHPLLSLLHVCQ